MPRLGSHQWTTDTSSKGWTRSSNLIHVAIVKQLGLLTLDNLGKTERPRHALDDLPELSPDISRSAGRCTRTTGRIVNAVAPAEIPKRNSQDVKKLDIGGLAGKGKTSTGTTRTCDQTGVLQGSHHVFQESFRYLLAAGDILNQNKLTFPLHSHVQHRPDAVFCFFGELHGGFQIRLPLNRFNRKPIKGSISARGAQRYDAGVSAFRKDGINHMPVLGGAVWDISRSVAP